MIDEVRDRASLRDEIDGPIRGSAFHCPMHDDRHASASLYEKDAKWYCHTCGKGGDVIDYVAARDGLSVRDAMHLLAAKHNVGRLPDPDILERKHKAQIAQDLEAEAIARRMRYLHLVDLSLRYCRKWLAAHASEIGSERWHRFQDRELWLAHHAEEIEEELGAAP